MSEMKAWRDRNHKGNKIRPYVRCIGCGKHGCITHWGDWCFDCNVKRMDRINARFEPLERSIAAATRETSAK